MLKAKVMKKAHIIARNELEGDYVARLSIALKKAWKQVKNIFEEAEKMNYKGIKISCTAELEDIEPISEDHVYTAASDDQDENSRIYGVSDKAIAKENNKIFIDSFMDFSVIFDGDTYNHKEEIKALAEKYDSEAKFNNRRKTWEVKYRPTTQDPEEQLNEIEQFINDIKNYDMSKKTARKLKSELKEVQQYRKEEM